jgi:hypothetical protein
MIATFFALMVFAFRLLTGVAAKLKIDEHKATAHRVAMMLLLAILALIILAAGH